MPDANSPVTSIHRSPEAFGAESQPLSPTPEDEKTVAAPAAPVTSTVRTAEVDVGNERQRGRVLGNPGMTAERGSNPRLGAAARQFMTNPKPETPQQHWARMLRWKQEDILARKEGRLMPLERRPAIRFGTAALTGELEEGETKCPRRGS